MDSIVRTSEIPRGPITAVINVELSDHGVLVTIGTHSYILDMDEAKELRDKLKVVIGSVE